jgi:hypothetical protein
MPRVRDEGKVDEALLQEMEAKRHAKIIRRFLNDYQD